MALLHNAQLAPTPASNGTPIPTVDRFTVANLPPAVTKSVNKVAIVTDAVSNTAGAIPAGGGSLLAVVWNNGMSWVVI